jgi:hypothetical protein
VHDAWLDEIDWTNVKNYKLKNPQATGDGLEDLTKGEQLAQDQEDATQFDQVKTIKSMLTIMQAGETVVRTIKRLGALMTNKYNRFISSKNRNHVRVYFI